MHQSLHGLLAELMDIDLRERERERAREREAESECVCVYLCMLRCLCRTVLPQWRTQPPSRAVYKYGAPIPCHSTCTFRCLCRVFSPHWRTQPPSRAVYKYGAPCEQGTRRTTELRLGHSRMNVQDCFLSNRHPGRYINTGTSGHMHLITGDTRSHASSVCVR